MLTEKTFTIAEYCFHCGEPIIASDYISDKKIFCCLGCQTIYSILTEHNLSDYYAYNDVPGQTQNKSKPSLDYLDVEEIISKLVDYQDEKISIITLYIPAIHCSSCIWLLENLYQLKPAILHSRIDFLKKQVSITFNKEISLKSIVELLTSIGYEPMISLQDVVIKSKTDGSERQLVNKIAVAGFCFGNVMLLSFPEYFGLGDFEKGFGQFFGWLNLAFSVPILLYSGRDYFASAWVNLKAKRLNLDFPLALGIAVMFVRSVYEIVLEMGPGFVDTLCGLVFFLLIGKWMQQRTFHHLSFERDYRSYFPVAVTVMKEQSEIPVPLEQLTTGDRILIRSQEIIPADAILLKGEAEIDFSFVTGESRPVKKVLGEMLYAGGRQLGGALEMEVVKPVSQSYLTQLWNNDAFTIPADRIKTFTGKVSRYFSVVLLLIAISSAGYWIFADQPSKALASFTAVLIIACPCALALSSPFTLASILSIFDKNRFYLRNTAVIEELARIDTFVFDKTGTITGPEASKVKYSGMLTEEQKQWLSDLARNSSHPMSRELVSSLNKKPVYTVSEYTEKIGRGISGKVAGNHVKLGSSTFLGLPPTHSPKGTLVQVMINDEYAGGVELTQNWRPGFKELTAALGKSADLHLISGDQDHDRAALLPFFANSRQMQFRQSPQDKLDYIRNLQGSGHKVMMLGDGLNDSGALKQSDLGIAVTDNINNFSPGCDGILDGHSFHKLPFFVQQAKDGVRVIHMSFCISLGYNALGLFFALQGLLSPLIAAILMPLSTVTIILFTTIASRAYARKNRLL
jgi:Cu+-exporting ATPase